MRKHDEYHKKKNPLITFDQEDINEFAQKLRTYKNGDTTKEFIEDCLKRDIFYYLFLDQAKKIFDDSSEDAMKVIMDIFTSEPSLIDSLLNKTKDGNYSIHDRLNYFKSNDLNTFVANRIIDNDVLFYAIIRNIYCVIAISKATGRNQQAILAQYLKKTFGDYDNVLPILVLEQFGHTCGIYALSSILFYFANTKENELLPIEDRIIYYPPRKKNEPGCEKTLKSITHLDAKITGIGGIFSIYDFQKLVSIVKLVGLVLHVDSEQLFISTVSKALSLKIPIILPYDRHGKNGASAHYKVICGIKRVNEGCYKVLVTGNYDYSGMTAYDVFHKSTQLKVYPSGFYVKYKTEEYKKVTDEEQLQIKTNKTIGDFKFFDHPEVDLTECLKHKLLLLMTKKMVAELRDNPIFQELLEHESKEPSKLETKVNTM